MIGDESAGVAAPTAAPAAAGLADAGRGPHSLLTDGSGSSWAPAYVAGMFAQARNIGWHTFPAPRPGGER